ncbi:MAG: GTP cyclohydrolase, FolE2/MptA family, partial [bacterium]
VSYAAIFDGELDRDGFRFRIGARVPITTLCPCSKELCDKSAHSQRAIVEIDVLSPSFIWLEELIDLAEKAASAPVYSLLKRPDEKFVTEQAYSNPRFVEDVAREVAQRFHSRRDIAEFHVTVSSEESIHNHSAFATIEGGIGRNAFAQHFSPLADDAYSTNF